MQLPSGRTLSVLDRELLIEAHQCGFVRYDDKPFELESGIMSHVYVFGRQDVTENPHLLWTIGQKVANLVSPLVSRTADLERPEACLIGLPMAGKTFAQAASMVRYDLQRRSSRGFETIPKIVFRQMRQKLKEGHGVHNKWVDGDYVPGRYTYWTVDNAVTGGKTKFKMAERLEADGYPTKEMHHLIFVNRQQGAIPKLQAAGFKNLIVAYNLLDITFAFHQLKLWSAEVAKRVEEEIRQNQFE